MGELTDLHLIVGSLFWQGEDTDELTDELTFVSLSSGSCGNCSILSLGRESIVIDAGVGIRKFHKTLQELPIPPSQVRGIFITHDHADHIRAAAEMAHKYQWPIYASPAVSRSLLYRRNAPPQLPAYLKPMEVGATVELGEMRIRSFEVPHDATQNVGYAIDTPHGRFTLIIDIGEVTPTILREVAEAKYLVFESNYDREMLLNGNYPFHLKERITSGWGHISNHQSAQVIAHHITEETRFVALCHLSGENNTPQLALQAHQEALNGVGKAPQLVVLKRGICSPIYTLSEF